MQRTKKSSYGNTGRRAAIGSALALGLAATSGAAYAALDCASLTTITPEASTITSATVVTPPASER